MRGGLDVSFGEAWKHPRLPGGKAEPVKVTVTCPICGACVGFRCVDHTGQIVSYHVERARAARWAEMDALPPFLGVVCEQNSHWGWSAALINITWRHRLKFDSVPAKPR